jgi:hypothetical protein
MKKLLPLVLLAGVAYAQVSQLTASSNPPAATPTVTDPDLSISPVNSVPAQLPDLLPKPEGNATLIGGTVAKVDRVRDEVVIRIFGGGTAHVLFDSRTHIYRDEAASSVNAIQTGDRIYADTKLAGKDIFAENIRVLTHGGTGQSIGQVVSYNPRNGDLVLSDAIFSRKMNVKVLPNTAILQNGTAIRADQLRAGMLVSLGMQSGAGQPIAQKISVLAAPGSAFVFVGQVTHLDLHIGLMVLTDPRDGKSYQVSFNPSLVEIGDDLHEGSTVEVTTTFNGRQYMASAIKVQTPPAH